MAPVKRQCPYLDWAVFLAVCLFGTAGAILCIWDRAQGNRPAPEFVAMLAGTVGALGGYLARRRNGS